MREYQDSSIGTVSACGNLPLATAEELKRDKTFPEDNGQFPRKVRIG
jgi:hypothetical protein